MSEEFGTNPWLSSDELTELQHLAETQQWSSDSEFSSKMLRIIEEVRRLHTDNQSLTATIAALEKQHDSALEDLATSSRTLLDQHQAEIDRLNGLVTDANTQADSAASRGRVEVLEQVYTRLTDEASRLKTTFSRAGVLLAAQIVKKIADKDLEPVQNVG